MKIEDVTACIVTRGDHDLDSIYFSLADAGIGLTTIWDNSKRPRDLSVYGRYALIEETDSEFIYVQDDDCVLPPEAIQYMAAMYPAAPYDDASGNDGWPVYCNMPEIFRHEFYADHALVGFGAVFHRDAPKWAFEQFMRGLDRVHTHAVAGFGGGEQMESWWMDSQFLRCCDVVFTALTPRVLVDAPYENLPWATDESRMYRQHEHVGERLEMLKLALNVRKESS